MAVKAVNQDPDMMLFNFYNGRSMQDRDTQRITSQEIAALKQADKKGQHALTTPAAALSSFFRGVAGSVMDALVPPVKKHAMCDNYGHIADLASWTDHLPKCSDCGKTITSRNELRGSVPVR
jgi:NADPH-dependent curcumin reductase CurA